MLLEPVQPPADWLFPNGETWKGQGHCICCNKPTKEPGWHVRFAAIGTDFLLIPHEQDVPEDEDRGWFPIGAGCLKKQPWLKKYAQRF